MGDSACVVPAFSYASGISNEANQGNPLHALGESVSFGRFMTDSLAWDKWSTFSQNRHVEEAERYAQPGSVAQKKAFFEAHYKRIAAKKAAALLEQENSASNSTEPNVEGGDRNDTAPNSETMRLSSQVVADEQENIKIQNDKENFIVNADGHNSNAKPDELGMDKVGGAELAKEPEVLVEIPTNIESLNKLENVEDQNLVSGLEKTLLKNYISNQDVSDSVRKKRPVLSSLKSTMFRRVTSTPAKTMPPLHPRKENNFTPSTINSTIDTTDTKRLKPKSLRKLINFTPASETEKLSTPAARKIESSRIGPISFKASKDCATPLRTPITASLNGVPKHPSTTPCSENKRANTPLDPSASGSKLTGPKWHLISSVCSKSLTACRKKFQSSTLSTPFVLRTEERAARRKQKLEERFNEKEAQKVQMQTRAKEKAETDVGKLSQSLCISFRARPLPEFYRERETSKKQSKKVAEVQPQSSKPGSSTIQDTKNPVTKSSTKAFKNFLKKNSQTHEYTV